VPLDSRVVLFAVLLSLSVGLVFSVAPAVRTSRAEAAETLKAGSASLTHRNLRVGSVLTALQLATSLTLVVGALLLTATIRELSRVDLGFQADAVYAFTVRPAALGYPPEQGAIYREEFGRRLRQMPGVEQVATVVRGAPFVSGTVGTRIRAHGSGELLEPESAQIISPGYFDTLRIPLRTGRVFTAEDFGLDGRAVRQVVVLSETAARQLFGTLAAVGQRVEYRVIGRVGQSYEVIGIVGDVRTASLTGPVEAMVYEPAALGGPVRAEATVLVRTTGGVNVAAQASTIGAALNPSLPVGPVRSMQEAISRSRAEWDVLARLMTTLAVIAGLLAAVGLYGVIAFGVAARRREFGIRLALGAPPAQLVGLVLRRTALIAGVGLVLGLGGAAAFSRSLGSRLFGVGPFDPTVWGMATTVFLVIALIASWRPARRAAYVDPVSALRSN
jgi:predicted permease